MNTNKALENTFSDNFKCRHDVTNRSTQVTSHAPAGTLGRFTFQLYRSYIAALYQDFIKNTFIGIFKYRLGCKPNNTIVTDTLLTVLSPIFDCILLKLSVDP